jgi:hypothetical protein
MDLLLNGNLVRLQGLQAAAAHNGKLGKVTSFDSNTGRYAVCLDHDGTKLAVKPGNLQLVDIEEKPDPLGASLQSKLPLNSANDNGTRPILSCYNRDKER